MALVLKDRVKETTASTGTSTINLAGAATGFEGFVSAVGSGNSCYYTILDANGSAWEVGIGTVTDASPDTLSRDTILESSNSDNAISLTSGTHTVFLTYPADKSVYRNSNDQIVATASGIVFSDSTVQTTAPVDTNTTYTAGSGLQLDSTTFNAKTATTSASGITTLTNTIDSTQTKALTPKAVNDAGYLTAHPSISAASDSNNSGRTYLQDLLLDSNGHVTGITTATETVTDTNTTYTAGSGLTLVGTEFNTAGTGNFEAIEFGSERYFSIVKIGHAITDQISSERLVLIGSAAGSGIQYSLNTVAIGYLAGAEASGNVVLNSGNNIFLGTRAGNLSSGCDFSNYIGYEAGKDANLSKYSNAFGRQSLKLASNSEYNNAIGYRAGDELSSSISNNFMGREAGCHATGVNNAIYIGSYAGCSSSNTNHGVFIGTNAGSDSQGSGNIYIGRQSGRSGTGSGNIEIVTEGPFSGILGSSSDKIHIQNIIIGDTSSKKLAIGNVGASNLDPDATLEIVSANVNDTGLLVHNLIAAETGILLPSTVPAVTTNKLYNNGGALTFNGSAVGGGSARSVAGDTDNGVITWVTSDDTFAVETGLTYTGGTLTATGIIDVTNTEDASDATGDTGAIRTEGGVSIAKKLYVGNNLDVLGTTNLEAVDIDGNVQLDGTLTVGVNDTGKDVKFFGATDGSYLEWDESEDRLNLVGASYVQEAVPANDTPTAASAQTLTFDLSTGNYHNQSLPSNSSVGAVNKIIFANAKRGQRFIIRLTQHASSANTVAWTNVDSDASNTTATIRWAEDITPTMSTSTSHTDVYGFLCTNNAGTNFDGFIIGQDLPDS